MDHHKPPLVSLPEQLLIHSYAFLYLSINVKLDVIYIYILYLFIYQRNSIFRNIAYREFKVKLSGD